MLRDGAHLLNIDHHHDNTRFGTLNHVVPDASCTAEIVWDLMHGLEQQPTPVAAQALYVGLITDTGRFMYENTGPRAHLMAAELIEAGVDVADVYRRLYEEMPVQKLTLMALALGAPAALRRRRADAGGAERRGLRADRGRGTLLRGDRRPAARGAGHEGRRVRARADRRRARGLRKVSLRATDDEVDVSVIAREQGGGGHRRAAGFSTTLPLEELIAFLRPAVAAQLHANTADTRRRALA